MTIALEIVDRLHPGQRAVLAAADRFNVVACGRRFGKTTLAQVIAALGAPGGRGGILHGQDIGWFAPSYKMMSDAFRDSITFLRDHVVRSDATQMRVDFDTGASLEMWTLDDLNAGRGRRYALVIVDEAAMSANLKPVWEQAIRPTLTDLAGGAWFFSTPKGRNYFHELSTREGRGAPGWKSHHAPTAANPYIPAAEIEEARRSLPERVFMQEYEAAFLEDGGGVFRRILEAIDDTLPTDPHVARDPNDGRGFVIGVDWGRVNDFTAIVVIDAKAKAVVAVDRFTDIDYGIQRARLNALHSRFTRAPIIAEANSMGGPLIEQLQRDGLPVQAFQTTNASKAGIIEALALAFEKGEIRIPRVQPLIDELLAYDQERLPSGAVRYGAPGGMHDDIVMALAIAWSGVPYAQPVDYSKGRYCSRREYEAV